MNDIDALIEKYLNKKCFRHPSEWSYGEVELDAYKLAKALKAEREKGAGRDVYKKRVDRMTKLLERHDEHRQKFIAVIQNPHTCMDSDAYKGVRSDYLYVANVVARELLEATGIIKRVLAE